MTDTNSGSSSPSNDGAAGEGVLSNLPRTRPQRASPRRTAARAASAKQASAPPAKPAPKAQRSVGTQPRSAARAPRLAAAKPRVAPPKPRVAAAKRRSMPTRTKAPQQGFEADPGDSLQPPGGIELVASAAEIVGELTKAGLSRSERLLKGIISRLPLS